MVKGMTLISLPRYLGTGIWVLFHKSDYRVDALATRPKVRPHRYSVRIFRELKFPPYIGEKKNYISRVNKIQRCTLYHLLKWCSLFQFSQPFSEVICRHSLAAHFLIGFFFVGFVCFFVLFLLFLGSISRDWIKWSPSCVWPPFRASITPARARIFNNNCSVANLPQLLEIIDTEMVEAIQFLALSLMKASYLTGWF